MRFLLLLLSLVLQLNISGYANFIPQENHVIETQTSLKDRLSVTFNRNGEYKIDCPFRFQGQYEDSETNNRFQHYSPDERIYSSQDQIGLNGGVNLYSYVQDINKYADPLGLIPTPLYETTNQTVYGIFDKGQSNPFYLGITNDFDRRMLEYQDILKGKDFIRFDPNIH